MNKEITLTEEKNSGSINRRKFISTVGLIGTAVGLNPALTFSGPRASAETSGIMKCKPYLQAPGQDHMTIRWLTTARCYSWVEYGERPDKLNLKARQVNDGLVQANNTIHDIPLKKLQAGKTYYYRAVSREITALTPRNVDYGKTVASEVYSFTVPQQNAPQVEFLVFNDVHDRPETFAHLMQYQGEGKKDFVLLNGDIFSALKDGEDQIVNHLLHPVSELFATHTPFIYSRGNHEARGNYARQLPQYLTGKEHKFYYSFQWGPLYAIVLDSGEDKADDEAVYGGIVDFDAYRLEQKAWLEQEVQKKEFRKAPYKVVFSHIPLYHTPNENAHGAKHCRDSWGPVLNKARIDLMISGHTHRYKIHQPIPGQHHYPIVIGGGPKDGYRALIQVKIDQKSLRLKITDENGKIAGTLNL